MIEFAKSPSWKKLLYYSEGDTSDLSNDDFFLSKEGRVNPYKELKATIEAFKNKQTYKESIIHCVLPARFHLINKQWPGYFKPAKCDELESWIENIDIDEIYLVYTSAYPNNPASMLGHTFLRFTRKKKGERSSTKELLGYSLAFLAQTNDEDNPFMYTLKGITGGYYGQLEIKPFYIDVGIYNNSESRDIWAHKLNMNDEQKYLLLLHAWELSVQGRFKYYFFNQNCSSLLLRMLEAIFPDSRFESKEGHIVIPQETYREVVEKHGTEESIFTPSISRSIEKRYQGYTAEQKYTFHNARKKKDLLSRIDDVDILDNLIDYWKMKNYKENGRISDDEKKRFMLTMKRRALVPTKSQSVNYSEKSITRERPDKGEGIHRAYLEGGDRILGLGLRYGFHDFSDPETGFDRKSYITFLEGEYKKVQEEDFWKVSLVDILSLQNFYWYLMKPSWHLNINFRSFNGKKKYELLGGYGVSQAGQTWQAYLLAIISVYGGDTSSHIAAGAKSGVKWMLNQNTMLSSELTYLKSDSLDMFTSTTQVMFEYERLQLGPVISSNSTRELSEWNYGFRLNFFY